MVATLCAEAQARVAAYYLRSAEFHSGGKRTGLIGQCVRELKYGENPWQTPAALYQDTALDVIQDQLAIHNFEQVAGTTPSFVNITDLDRLVQTLTHMAAVFKVNEPAVDKMAVAVKHGNPCGAGVSPMDHSALQKMIDGDRQAIFGASVMVNFPLAWSLPKMLLTHGLPKTAKADPSARRLLDIVAAPDFSRGALELLRRKNDKCRLFANPALDYNREPGLLDKTRRLRQVRGGFLTQPNYEFVLNLKNGRIEKIGPPLRDYEHIDLLLAWAVNATANSNTVTLVKNGQLIGNGVGQQDRVTACRLAINRARQAGHSVEDAVAVSDSFFPFIDGPQVLGEAGVRVIFATSGSVRDDEVKAFCERAGVTLWLLPDAVARGFFGH